MADARALAPRSRRSSRPGRRGVRAALIALILLALGVVALNHWKGGVREAVAGMRARSHVPRVELHAEAIRFAASESRLDPNLLAAVMLSESGGRVDAVSSVGALGLYQLMLPTAIERALKLRLAEPTRGQLLKDAQLNTRLGASYLKWLEQRYDGDLERMLIAYNAGPGRLERWIRDAGGYDAWRAERAAAGDSGVLRYAAKVERFRELFAERAIVAPPVDQPPAAEADSEAAPASETLPIFGPAPPDEHDPASDDDGDESG